MGWEKRNRKRYYYVTYHFNGKKRRMCLGPQGDPVAELAAVNAALDQINRELDERAYAKKVARHRDGPIVAGGALWIPDETGHRVVRVDATELAG